MHWKEEVPFSDQRKSNLFLLGVENVKSHYRRKYLSKRIEFLIGFGTSRSGAPSGQLTTTSMIIINGFGREYRRPGQCILLILGPAVESGHGRRLNESFTRVHQRDVVDESSFVVYHR